MYRIRPGVQVGVFYTSGDGRYAAIEARLSDRKILIIALYAPASSPRDRALFYQQILPDIVQKSKAAGNAELMILGDFKVTLEEYLKKL